VLVCYLVKLSLKCLVVPLFGYLLIIHVTLVILEIQYMLLKKRVLFDLNN